MLTSLLSYRSAVFGLLLLGAAGAPAHAGAPGLSAALEAAWQRWPEGRTLTARRAEMQAGQAAAQNRLAAPPTLGLSQRRQQGAQAARETELSLAAPLWLPGQYAARQLVAHSGADELETQLAQARLTLAGEVREHYWALQAARASRQEAGQHLDHLSALADEVLQRVRAGDLARTDGMLAQQEVLAAKVGLTLAEARLQEAESRYATLTGLAAPEDEAEPGAAIAPAAAAATALHPGLQAAHSAIRSAQAALQLSRHSRSEPPTLGLALRREQADGSAVNRSISLALQIPLGSAARNRPQETAALTRLETARADAEQIERQLAAGLALAQQQALAAEQALAFARERSALGREHSVHIEQAFRLGERGLAERLRAQALLHEAEAAQAQQRVALGLALSRLQQARGVLP
ncbi:MAG: TolC family protein [Burkholderiales bacterium]|nr:TolC family protein [Burkholderiales bacterium]